MSLNLVIANRLREVLLNGKWIANTNFKEQILSVDYLKATTKIEECNTIAALTFHINYYLQGLIQVLNGGSLEIKDKYSFELPTINNQDDWISLVDSFITNAELFTNKVEQLPDAMLSQTFGEEKYGNYLHNIEAVIEHSYYHLGQVVLLVKLIK